MTITKTTELERVATLLAEKRALPWGELGGLQRYSEIRDEIKAIKAAVDLETFSDIRDLELLAKGLTKSQVATSGEKCVCSHRRGMHNSVGCCVGHDKWNAREGRNEPHCYCHGFVDAVEAAKAQAEADEEEAERERDATHQCSECEHLFVEDELGDLEPLYECNDCGTVFTRSNSYDGGSHKCPDCSRFSSKLSEDGCSECGAGEVLPR